VLRRARDLTSRLVGWLAALPLRPLNEQWHAQVLCEFTSSLIANVSVENGMLRFSASTPTLYGRARGALTKEPDTIEWINGFHPGDVLWDIGANVGVFSLYAATRPNVQVLAFEPFAANFAVLSQNIFINALGERVVPYCVAFAGTTELGVLNSPSRELGSSLHQFGRPGEVSPYWEGTVSHAQGVVGYTVDDFIVQFDPPFPTHIKLDVDGIEWLILKGASKTLRDPRLHSVMAELNLNDVAELERVKDLMLATGFEDLHLGQKFALNGQQARNHFFNRKQYT
jgi:FkbM family methyltransferase